jgi:hypothetical protein
VAFSLTCPNCAAKLKTAANLTGKKVQCPKCKESFTASAGDIEEVPDARPAAKPAAAAAAARTRAKAPVRKPLDDDEDETPRSRRRGEDEETAEAPRSRRRDADDTEVAPRSRRRDADEDDEKPARRRRDEDDEEDRPRSRRRAPAKKSGNGMLIGLIAGGVVAVGLIVFAIIYFTRDKKDDKKDGATSGSNTAANTNNGGGGGGGGGQIPVKDLLAFAPADAALVAAADINQIRKLEPIKPFLDKLTKQAEFAKVTEGLNKAGLTLDDFGKVMLTMTDPERPDAGSGPVVVLRFTRAVDKAKVVQAIGAVETKQGGKSYYSVPGGEMNFFFASGDTLVGAVKTSTLITLMNKPAGQVSIDPDLAALAGRFADSQIGFAGSKALLKSGAAGGLGDAVQGIQAMKGLAVWANVSGSQLTLNSVIKMNDAQTAAQLAEQSQTMLNAFKAQPAALDQLKAMGPDVHKLASEALNSVTIGSSGDELTGSVSVNFPGLVSMIEKQFAGGAMGGTSSPKVTPKSRPNPSFPPGGPKGPPRPPVFPKGGPGIK